MAHIEIHGFLASLRRLTFSLAAYSLPLFSCIHGLLVIQTLSKWLFHFSPEIHLICCMFNFDKCHKVHVLFVKLGLMFLFGLLFRKDYCNSLCLLELYSWFASDVTAAMLVYRTMVKEVFWEFGSIIMQNLSDILPLFCKPTCPPHHVSATQE